MKKSTKRLFELVIAGTFLVGNPLEANAPLNPDRMALLREFSPYYNGLSKFFNEKKAPEYLSKSKIRRYVREAIKKINPPNPINEEYIINDIGIESSFNRYAKSNVDARGLMQLMEPTWNDIEKRHPFEKSAYNPRLNIETGIREKARLVRRFEKEYEFWKSLSEIEQLKLLSAASNVGYERLKGSNWNISEMPKETIDHVKKLEKEYNSNF